MDRAYCINCDEKVPFVWKSRPVHITVTTSAHPQPVEFTYDEQYAVCSKCGEEIYVAFINDLNVDMKEKLYKRAKDGYRETHSEAV